MKKDAGYYTNNFLEHYCNQLKMIGIPEEQMGVFIGAVYNSMKMFVNENKEDFYMFKKAGKYNKE